MKHKRVLAYPGFVVAFLTLFIPFFSAWAANVQLQNPVGASSIMDLIQGIIKDFLVPIGAPIAVVMIIWGAFQMLFSGGKPESFENGRNTILYAVAGYGIIIIGWGIVAIIQQLLQ